MDPGTEASDMDRFASVWASIRKNLRGMGPTHKLLIGSLAIIMVMTLFLVSQYAGKSKLVEVWPTASPEDQARAITALRLARFDVVNQGDKAMVPEGQRDTAIAVLAQSGEQPTNSAIVFENILKTQSWINSKEDNRNLFKLMRDNWLAGVIAKLDGIDHAKVYVDAPEQIGFGAAARPPKGLVTIWARPGHKLSDANVDAAARLVAGAVAGLDIERVSVIDGSTNASRRVRSDDDLSAVSGREYARALERQFEDKIEMLLQGIAGVRVIVTATVDASRTRAQIVKSLPMGEGSLSTPKKESISSITDTQAAAAAQPGPRSNVGADINYAGGGSGSRNEQRQEDTEYHVAVGTERREIESAAGTPLKLVATIAVPRWFIAELVKRDAGAPAEGGEAPPPDPAAIRSRFDQESAAIKASLEPHFNTRSPDGAEIPGEVVVMLASDDAPPPGASGGGGGAVGLAGLGTMWAAGGDGMVDKIVLGALAAVAMGMMLLLVRKAGKRAEIPTAEELVGLPPTLDARSDLIGEADESDTVMPGIEVGEDEMKMNKMRESVSEFIKNNPETASRLLNRWISVEQ